jgi:hypothetical protein
MVPTALVAEDATDKSSHNEGLVVAIVLPVAEVPSILPGVPLGGPKFGCVQVIKNAPPEVVTAPDVQRLVGPAKVLMALAASVEIEPGA